MLLYLGPGLSMTTLIVIGLVLAIVLLSLGIVLIRPIKRFIAYLKRPKNE